MAPAETAPVPVAGEVLPLRRLTVADVLDGAVRTFRSVVGPAVLVVLLILGPLVLLTNLVLAQIAPQLVGQGLAGLQAMVDIDAAVAGPVPAGAVAAQLLGGLVGWLLGLIASSAVIALVLARDRGVVMGAGAAVAAAARALPAVLIASLLIGVLGAALLIAASLLSLVVLVVPVVGVIVLVLVIVPGYVVGLAAFFGLTSLVVPVVVAERLGPLRAVGRTLAVFRRAPLRILWITLLMGVVVAVIGLTVQLPMLTLAGVVPAGAWVVESLGEVGAQVVSVPLTALAALLVYLDVRVRHEALDLRVRARHWS